MNNKNLLLKICLIIFLVMQSITMMSQGIEVHYEMVPNVANNMRSAQEQMGMGEMGRGVMAQIQSAMQGVKVPYVLTYNKGKSLYKSQKVDKLEVTVMGQTVDISSRLPEDITYRDHNAHKEIQQKEMMGKRYLVESALEADQWQILDDETKMIAGYSCVKAISTTDSTEVWFTRNIPVSDGPVYTGLPGLVLELKSKERHIIANSVGEAGNTPIVPPSKGKQISKEEFIKMAKRKMAMVNVSGPVFSMGM